MSGSGPSHEYSPQNPVRIVYRAGDRTFARLFNERSLKEVKDVIRRKLGLGSETDVSLKQMGPGMLLDLDDDDDFQAFRVFLRSSASVDIQVTIGEPRGAAVSPLTVAPTATPQPRKQPTTSEPTRFPSPGPSKVAPGGVTASNVQVSAPSPELIRKRKALSGNAGIADSSKLTERSALVEPIAATSVASGKGTKSLAAPRPEPSVEPPKKKQKNEPTKAKPTGQGTLSEPIAVAPDIPSGRSSESESAAEDPRQPLVGMSVPIRMRRDTFNAFRAHCSIGVESPKPEATSEAPKLKVGEGAAKKSMPKDSGELVKPAAGASDVPSGRVVESPKPETAAEAPKQKVRKVAARKSNAGIPPKTTMFRGVQALRKPVEPAEDIQTTHAPESPAEKASASVPIVKPKKSAILGRGDEAGTGTPRDTESSEIAVTKQKKQKKEGGTRLKKSSAPADKNGTDKPIDQPSSSTSRQPEISIELNAEGDAAEKYTQAPKGMVCASIPQTSASRSVRSEVAAAILSGHLSILPKPPANGKSVKRDTKKPSASSNALPMEPTTTLDAPAREIPNALAEAGPELAVLTNGLPRQTPDLNGPPCPICLEVPFHIRFYCPVVLKGPDAIRERLEELKRTNTDNQRSLIKQLDGLLRESEVTSKLPLNVAPANDVQSDNVSLPPNISFLGAPSVPSNSTLSEIIVESRDDENTSDSSDDASIGEVEPQESPVSRRHEMPDEQPLPYNNDLEVIVRGPVLKRKSVLHLLDRIIGDEDSEDSHSEEDQAELEEDADEETGRRGHRPPMRVMRSFESESEEESSSSSPPRSAEGTPKIFRSGIEGSGKSLEKHTEHKKGDVVIGDTVDPPVLEGQDDDSSEVTHVGSEDRMAVDESAGEKGPIISIHEEFLPAPEVLVARPPDVPSDPQGSTTTSVHPAADRDGGVLVATEVLKEVEADPIEPADDLQPPAASRSLNADPIEAPSEDNGSPFNSLTQSTPASGVSKRIKTRSGQILDDEADYPVLLGQLTLKATTPVPEKEKSRRKIPTSQEPTSTRKSPRFSSLPPATSTPAVIALLNHRSKPGIRTGKGAKIPAKQSEERSDGLRNSTAYIAPTPSLARWETLAEPSSPSVQQDELMASSSSLEDDPVLPQPTNKGKKGRPRMAAVSDQTQGSQGKERLFDLSSSQIPFPYSQNQTGLAPTASFDGKESEGTTDSEDEPPVKRLAQAPAQFRSLSQLASTAVLYSPSLSTATRSVTNGKAKKHVIDEESSSSSSSSDTNEASGSGHIPRGRKAGAALRTKRKSILSKF